jgi:hypothetical protein
MTTITEEGVVVPLRTTFTRDGFSYNQIWRDDDVAVYEYDSRGGSFGVVVILMEGERVKFGKLTPQHEVYPTTTQRGTYGWTFGPKDRAPRWLWPEQ